ncbi:MAG: hypothetical protein HOI95_21980 [Chromatiales bacterium]|nr:hypothetical protein [Chromatiales bacterium]
MADRPGPLAGVKAVTCSTAQAGTVPYMLMADLGADAIFRMYSNTKLVTSVAL